eukprot:TRINITY_DN2629_c1_g1_i1.p1 TRINITY_DN2629_c1_g1~~TRINITY_DN2629_c1_g1_i1.p1  ORF type:complete len:243 (+),score=72.37 TRINITY_DN2629_c1_g1_i1:83-730(+)
MGKGGASKGSTVAKPWLKKSTSVVSKPISSGKASKGSSKGTSKGSSKGGSIKTTTKTQGSWVFVPASKQGKVSSKGGGKGTGKGKGKGKGKLRPAGLKSSFWENKLGEENRAELGNKTYSGTVVKYFWRQGWGLIVPDNFNGLPKKVKEAMDAAMQESMEKAAAAGREAKDQQTLYFRKPDINHQEGFKVAPEVAVTFSLYMDEKGAGAKEVSPA